ncbi:MAG: AI-2E family transporter [Candidatus Gastranaerophilales bacterium]|nr:AI-2E family transporter [Candidatus Gastranaerophilales bacterium]
MFSRNNFLSYYKTAIFLIMAVLVIIFVGKIADIAIMFFGAFIVSASLLPVVNKLKNFMPRGLAVALVLLLLLAGVLLIFIPLGMLTINQSALLIDKAPEQIDKLLNFQLMGHSVAEFIDLADFENFGQTISSFAANILNQGFSAGKLIANSITSILMTAIMIFYLMLDEEHMKNAYLSFFPPKFKKKASEILEILKLKVGGYVLAQILSMAAVGIMTFIGLAIVHHPQTALVSFLAFILDIIPVIGSSIAVIIGAITAHDGGIGYMVLVFVIMLIAQWLQNQVAKPLLFGKFMDMHPLLIVVSLLIGAKFLGFLGVILGPAFASLVCVLVNELYIKQINSDSK